MKIGIQRIGQTDSHVTSRIQENLKMVLSKAELTLIREALPIPEEALNEDRQQHRSDIILRMIHEHAEKRNDLDRVLGIVDTDIYMPDLNYVFGQAEYPGKAALISLWRLRPEFYKRSANVELLIERGTKEAVHELGHTIGLKHCANPFCVMYFSNSIFETDRKQSLFCSKCHMKIEAVVGRSG